MFAVFLLLILFPVMCYIWIGAIVSLFKRPKNKPQNNHQSYGIDIQAKEEEQRINEWGLDDDWRWGKL